MSKDAVSAGKEPSAQIARSGPSAAAPVPSPIGAPQRLGNQYLHMLLSSRRLQPKLSVSDPSDVFEREADRVADQVMRMREVVAPDGLSPVERRTTDTPNAVSRHAASSDSPVVDAATESSIRGLGGRGSALPDSVRSYMEPRFNADFSAVRVHTDSGAHALARAVNAQAFTVGQHVVFGAGRYSPDTETGRRLLAHELTHVVQQGAASPSSGGAVLQRDVDLELERQSPKTTPSDQRDALGVKWYVEMDPATPIVAAGTEVAFHLRNSDNIAVGWDEVTPDSGRVPVFFLSDEHGHHKAFKPQYSIARVRLTTPGKFRATFIGYPFVARGPAGPDRNSMSEHGSVRVSIDFDVVGDVSPQTVNAPGIRSTAATDMLHLEAPETSGPEIAVAFEQLAMRRAFQVLEENRIEAEQQLAIYTRGVDGKTGAKAIDELAPIVDLDAKLKREDYLLFHDKDRLIARAEEARRSPPEFQAEQHQGIMNVRAALVDAFPALALVNHAGAEEWTFKNHPEERQRIIRSGLQQVLSDIEKAKRQLASGELSIMRVEPILAETRQILGLDANPAGRKAVDELLRKNGIDEAKLGMAVGAASLLLLFLPGIGPYLAASVGIAWAARSWIRVGQLRAAAGAGVRQGIVDKSDVVMGTFWSLLDSAFAALDLGTAVAKSLAVAKSVAPHVEGAVERLAGRGAAKSAEEVRQAEIAARARLSLTGDKDGARLAMTETELRMRVSELFRRPMRDMSGEIHFFDTEAEYQAEFARQFPEYAPTRAPGYFAGHSGHIYLSPRGGLRTLIHELAHKVFDEAMPLGHALIGSFLEEGIVETITRACVGKPGFRSRYDTHAAFVGLLQKRLGAGVVEDLVLHGDYKSFRAAIKGMFLGSEEKTFKFLNTLRAVDGGATDSLGNPDALKEAIEMIQEADRNAIPHSPPPVHPRDSRPTVVQTPEQRAKLLDHADHAPAPHQPTPRSHSSNGHAEPDRPRFGPDDFDDETPTPRIGRPRRPKVDPLKPRSGEINVHEKPPSKKATITKGPTVEVVDAAMVERARERLRDVIMQAVVSGTPKTVVVESVEFGNISAVLRPKGELLVLRELIFNMGGPGQGSFIHGAFEQAAIDIARQLGARSVRVGMHPLLNKTWAKELMKLGYKFEDMPWGSGAGIKLNVLIRTLPL